MKEAHRNTVQSFIEVKPFRVRAGGPLLGWGKEVVVIVCPPCLTVIGGQIQFLILFLRQFHAMVGVGEREGGGGGGVVLRATVGQRMERGDRLRVIDEQ